MFYGRNIGVNYITKVFLKLSYSDIYKIRFTNFIFSSFSSQIIQSTGSSLFLNPFFEHYQFLRFNLFIFSKPNHGLMVRPSRATCRGINCAQLVDIKFRWVWKTRVSNIYFKATLYLLLFILFLIYKHLIKKYLPHNRMCFCICRAASKGLMSKHSLHSRQEQIHSINQRIRFFSTVWSFFCP